MSRNKNIIALRDKLKEKEQTEKSDKKKEE